MAVKLTINGLIINYVASYALTKKWLVAKNVPNIGWCFEGASDNMTTCTQLCAQVATKQGFSTVVLPVPRGDDNHAHYAAVLDTEYIVTDNGWMVYDIGLVVMDTSTGEIIKSMGFLIDDTLCEYRETFKLDSYLKGDKKIPCYYKQNTGFYLDNMDSRYNRVSFQAAMAYMETILIQYEIKAPYAFCGIADIKALNDTGNKFKVSVPLNIEVLSVTPKKTKVWIEKRYDVFDLYPACREVLLATAAYKQWCFDYRYLTGRNNPSCTAESVFSWITKNPTHKEMHNGLQDAIEEATITMWVLNNGYKLEKRVSIDDSKYIEK
jgi:hypothetical protein